jgi:hypothetical protein
MNNTNTNRMPVGTMRYEVVARFEGERCGMDSKGCTNTFDAARRHADELVGTGYEVRILDRVLGYAIWPE